jgi:predicted DCC family thiol-disulfide oxidoreductase YuxK
MPDSILTVIFDGDCGVCQALRARAARLDCAGRLHFVPNQAADLETLAPGLTRAEASRALYAVAPDGRRWRGARAFFVTMRHLPGVWRWIGAVGALPPLSLLAEPCYQLIAHHRARVSRWLGLDACRIELPDESSPGGR